MTRTIGWGPASRAVLVLAGVTVVLGVKLAASVLAPIVMGASFALVSYPAVAALRRKGLPIGRDRGPSTRRQAGTSHRPGRARALRWPSA